MLRPRTRRRRRPAPRDRDERAGNRRGRTLGRAARAALGCNVRPDTVFFEDLTFEEIREAIGAGTTNVIIATGGVVDDGPALVAGTPNDIVTYTADRIARTRRDTFVAPVIAYAPDGVVALPTAKAYLALLEAAALSAKASGFKNIFLLGESASSQAALKATADKLDVAWKSDGIRVVYLSDYIVKSSEQQRHYVTDKLNPREAEPSQRARFIQTAEVLAINGQRVRLDRLEATNPAPAPQHGLALLGIKVDAAVEQIRSVTGHGAATGPAGGAPSSRTSASVYSAHPKPFSGGFDGQRNPRVDRRWPHGRDHADWRHGEERLPHGDGEAQFPRPRGRRGDGQKARQRAGCTGVAIRAGGTGHTRHTGRAVVSTRLLEGVVGAVADSLKALGFREVLLVGDNGGNQVPLGDVAGQLNTQWEGSGVRAFALTDFYEKGHEYQDAWLLGQFGWDEAVVGSHAGIKDTSQLLYVKPKDVRVDRIADSFNNRRESGISGDPTKATADSAGWRSSSRPTRRLPNTGR